LRVFWYSRIVSNLWRAEKGFAPEVLVLL
jgi:hypothetical protein